MTQDLGQLFTYFIGGSTVLRKDDICTKCCWVAEVSPRHTPALQGLTVQRLPTAPVRGWAWSRVGGYVRRHCGCLTNSQAASPPPVPPVTYKSGRDRMSQAREAEAQAWPASVSVSPLNGVKHAHCINRDDRGFLNHKNWPKSVPDRNVSIALAHSALSPCYSLQSSQCGSFKPPKDVPILLTGKSWH